MEHDKTGWIPFTHRDLLFLRTHSQTAGLRLNLRVKTVGPRGDIQYTDLPLTTAASVTETLESMQLGDGWLIHMAVTDIDANIDRGQCFVQAGFLTGIESFQEASLVLISDYIAAVAPLSWPIGSRRHMHEGPGRLRTIAVTTPAAGAEWTQTVTPGEIWRPHTLVATLTTDATVATRTFVLQITDQVPTVIGESPSMAGQSASLARTYDVSIGLNSSGSFSASRNPVPMPILRMPLSGRIRSSTSNIQAGDQWSAISLCVESWQRE